MVKDDGEPWDARLIAWMQRGSARAGRKGKRASGLELVGYGVWGTGAGQLFSGHWYPFAICAALALALVQIGRRIS